MFHLNNNFRQERILNKPLILSRNCSFEMIASRLCGANIIVPNSAKLLTAKYYKTSPVNYQARILNVPFQEIKRCWSKPEQTLKAG